MEAIALMKAFNPGAWICIAFDSVVSLLRGKPFIGLPLQIFLTRINQPELKQEEDSSGFLKRTTAARILVCFPVFGYDQTIAETSGESLVFSLISKLLADSRHRKPDHQRVSSTNLQSNLKDTCVYSRSSHFSMSLLGYNSKVHCCGRLSIEEMQT